MSGDLLLMGVIVGVHGIRGEVKIKTFSQTPEAIAAYGALQSKSGAEKFKIKRHRVAKGVLVAKLIGVNDRNAAEALRGTELYLPRAKLPELSDGEEFYHADLVGLRAEQPDGTLLGTVVALQNFGGGDMVEIQPAGGGETEFVPFTHEVVPEVNVDEGRIVVVRPEEIE